MKKWIAGIILALFAIVSLVVSALYVDLALFSDTNSSLQEINSQEFSHNSTDNKETNGSLNSTKSPPLLETTILEVKPSKYILATEAEDYEKASKILKKEQNLTAIKNYKSICKKEFQKPKKKRIFDTSTPKLAIIMDDIGNINQAKNLQKLGMKITPSIFPSTKRHIDTPKIAKSFKHYMVHLPMEAFSFKHPEEHTLKVKNSLQEIDDIILKIHKDFPQAVSINNHTGSKFTSNIEAMDRLFCALKKYDMKFIDSKTAPKTFGKKMGKIYSMQVYQRDIFLDNKADVNYILSQIKKSIKLAKKRGLAIAICHPRRATFKALKIAKESLFGDVRLIYIDALY
jgi:polysaccharide deacetylase 2 family uncharacterized protein YibQ